MAIRSVCTMAVIFINLILYLAWYDIENRRRFFESYAESHGFDPEVPENWYSQPSKSFFAIKVAHLILQLCSRSYYLLFYHRVRIVY